MDPKGSKVETSRPHRPRRPHRQPHQQRQVADEEGLNLIQVLQERLNYEIRRQVLLSEGMGGYEEENMNQKYHYFK